MNPGRMTLLFLYKHKNTYIDIVGAHNRYSNYEVNCQSKHLLVIAQLLADIASL